MRKENRKAAQERRAKERENELRKAKMRVWIPTVIGIAVFVVLLVGIIMTSGCVGGQKDSEGTSVNAASTEASTETGTPSLDTTQGLIAADGDKVNIDYVGKVDGVAFEGGSTNGAGADLVLGSGAYIDGFEEQVVGHSVGETFDINVTFPENYGATELAGKDAVFTITLNGIYK